MNVRRIVLLSLMLAVAGPLAASRAAGPPAFRLIINASNPQTAIDRRVLADVFLKKVTRWGSGDPIHPVDQGADSPTRQRFSEDVLGRSVSAVKSYWAQNVFAGHSLPPPELDDDEEVLRYVAAHVGAIGYVSGTTSVERVKALTVR